MVWARLMIVLYSTVRWMNLTTVGRCEGKLLQQIHKKAFVFALCQQQLLQLTYLLFQPHLAPVASSPGKKAMEFVEVRLN